MDRGAKETGRGDGRRLFPPSAKPQQLTSIAFISTGEAAEAGQLSSTDGGGATPPPFIHPLSSCNDPNFLPAKPQTAQQAADVDACPPLGFSAQPLHLRGGILEA